MKNVRQKMVKKKENSICTQKYNLSTNLFVLLINFYIFKVGTRRTS